MKEEIKKRIEHNFNNSMDKLIDAFVLHYGEDYREIIKERISKIEFIFYCNDKKTKPIFSKINPASKNLNYLNTLYLDLVQEIREKTKKYLFSPGIKNTLSLNLNKVVYTSADIQNFNLEETKRLDENIRNNNTQQCSILKNGNYKQKVYIPLFFSGDKELIHEIAHAIKRSIIGTADGFTVDKMGLSTYKDDVAIDEIITDIDADIIYDKFKKMNASVIGEYFFYENLNSFYENFKTLIMPFYEKFKKTIINAGLTFNKNYLLETIGKDNYIELNIELEEIYDHISDILNSYINYTDSQKEEEIRTYRKSINDIIARMLAYEKNNAENQENVEAYMEYLERMGYKVKRSEKTL